MQSLFLRRRGGVMVMAKDSVLCRAANVHQKRTFLLSATRPFFGRTAPSSTSSTGESASDTNGNISGGSDASDHSSTSSSSSSTKSTSDSSSSSSSPFDNLPSGVPTNKGTMAALASMRVRRMAQQEELAEDREAMMRAMEEDSRGAASSSSSQQQQQQKPITPPTPTDAEVKAWKAQRDAEAAALLLRKQRMARDAFVRDILGPASSSSSSTTPPSQSKKQDEGGKTSKKEEYIVVGDQSKKTTKFALFDSEGKPIPTTATERQSKVWAPKDPLSFYDSDKNNNSSGSGAPSKATATVGGRVDPASLSTPAAAKAAKVDPQEKMDVFNFPVEETAERLREAALKMKSTNVTSFTIAEMNFRGRRLMIQIAIGGIIFWLIPIAVDPFFSLGDVAGGRSIPEKERIRRAQEANVRAALVEKRKASLQSAVGEGGQTTASSGGEDDDDDVFYSSAASPSTNAATAGAAATKTATEEEAAPSTALATFNPLTSFFSTLNWYRLVLTNIPKARFDTVYDARSLALKERQDENKATLNNKNYLGFSGAIAMNSIEKK